MTYGKIGSRHYFSDEGYYVALMLHMNDNARTILRRSWWRKLRRLWR